MTWWERKLMEANLISTKNSLTKMSVSTSSPIIARKSSPPVEGPTSGTIPSLVPHATGPVETASSSPLGLPVDPGDQLLQACKYCNLHFDSLSLKVLHYNHGKCLDQLKKEYSLQHPKMVSKGQIPSMDRVSNPCLLPHFVPFWLHSVFYKRYL